MWILHIGDRRRRINIQSVSFHRNRRICRDKENTVSFVSHHDGVNDDSAVHFAGIIERRRLPAVLCGYSRHRIHFPDTQELLARRQEEGHHIGQMHTMDMGFCRHVDCMPDHDRPHSVLLFQVIPHAFHTYQSYGNTSGNLDNPDSIGYTRLLLYWMGSSDTDQMHRMVDSIAFLGLGNHIRYVITYLQAQILPNTMYGIPRHRHR